jgi:hypothetical protein
MKKRGYLVAFSIENDIRAFPTAWYVPWALTLALAYDVALMRRTHRGRMLHAMTRLYVIPSFLVW